MTPIIPRPSNKPGDGRGERCIAIARCNWNETIANFICRRRARYRAARRNRELVFQPGLAGPREIPPSCCALILLRLAASAEQVLDYLIYLSRALAAAKVTLVRQTTSQTDADTWRLKGPRVPMRGCRANRKMTHARFDSFVRVVTPRPTRSRVQYDACRVRRIENAERPTVALCKWCYFWIIYTEKKIF